MPKQAVPSWNGDPGEQQALETVCELAPTKRNEWCATG